MGLQGRGCDGPEAPERPLVAEEIRVTERLYDSLPAALESDHKPVVATLEVRMPVTDQARPAAPAHPRRLFRRKKAPSGALQRTASLPFCSMKLEWLRKRQPESR